MDWMKEQSSLQKLSYNIQNEIATLLETILIQTPSDQRYSFNILTLIKSLSLYQSLVYWN